PTPPMYGSKRRWNKDEDAQMRQLYASGGTPAEIAARLGRTITAVQVRLSKMGISNRSDRAAAKFSSVSAKPGAVGPGNPPFEAPARWLGGQARSEEQTSELQSRENLECRLLLEKKKE